MEVKDSNGNVPQWTGIWIPREIINSDLKLAEMAFYGMIGAFGSNGCYMLAEDIENKLNISASTRRRYIKHLVDLGFISCKKQINGRLLLKTTLGFHAQNDAENTKKHKTTNQPTKQAKALETQNKGLVEQKKQQTYGNDDINWAFEFWEEQIGTTINCRMTANRRACYNLLRKKVSKNLDKGRETVKSLILLVKASRDDKFAPRISNFEDLQQKLDKLIAWRELVKAPKKEVVQVKPYQKYDRRGLPSINDREEWRLHELGSNPTEKGIKKIHEENMKFKQMLAERKFQNGR